LIKFNRSFDPEKIKLVIFDLDGTLIDSRLDLVYAVNAMRRHFGRAELSGDLIASYVGDGAGMLIRRALSDSPDEEAFKEGLDYYLAWYGAHKLDHTRVYPGMIETLAAIERSASGEKRKLAVLSNKPLIASREIVIGLGMERFFSAVYGGDSFAKQKPDPLGARTIMEETGTACEATLIIGDSANDILTGRSAGAWTCGVTYGFAPGSFSQVVPDVIVDTAGELREILG
jgi:phosphoglycolate phosphatase